ncbi:hypothetical protein A3H10_01795 [Candidatus Uhrbacteria bacterium RIFCSPLOWO2_12_FULL_46_10]|uniref:Bacterial type II secretion system protein E domain-containing protein n=1 Tax=Candidatus Uhrbacteria bacterium RIFCSPLOWO2_01_FULL_47_25 TaxID=1802402 RepID=A0A1F7USY9_9BACT|nr:MAG: Twitching motility protein [Parcubacteria group bacterium GW2011_GWA2_46_9]OGL60745.1 MAG: hypothetical protein A2752_03335 [Candidatus Uhrbacteria bacterium RIFCSPHIGHO2_01_FULL_46_23]OGL69542.1 MAG: hypothetical protein A3D60_00880 [Candidatus Uhrbacteria bacterium RIFCSPHIGHO2_02_FULL_47_29]OGL76004.1 MAG: hypothetical protein A3E96_02100 [Candidatus Uhrbacteria bacterium RIFCSPHIGHO2_12_FULL_46_13]OGL81401.1 MAG: hypothetical protein A2936_00200 [Candidatus Uhrbacteria bacterium RIF
MTNTSNPQPQFHDALVVADKQGASEVHYAVGSSPIMRLADNFVPIDGFPALTPEQAEEITASFLSQSEQEYLRARREITGAYTFPNGLRCRYHVFFQKGYPSFSIHLLPQNLPTIESLRLPKIVETLSKLPHGLVAVTGPYGSGRSSTIAALLNSINQTRAARILTLESPIEFIFDSAKSLVEQREVGRDAESYEAALRQILGEDVDVVMVAEVTSANVASLLMELASSRLVLAMFDDPTSVKVIEHILSLFPAAEEAIIRSTLADVLGGVVVQRILSRAQGGRTMICEILLGTPSIKTIIRDGKLIQLVNIIQTSRAEGLISLDQALAEAVRANEISADDAQREAVDPHYLQSLFKRGA